MLTAEQMRQYHLERDLAVYALLGAVRVIAADRVGLGAEHQQQELREALARCDARMAKADALAEAALQTQKAA